MLLTYVFLVAWAVWLGSVVFFSFVLAPTAFRSLGPNATPLLRALFPHYYGVGLASGAVMLATSLALRAGLLVTVPIVIAAVLAAYARQVITPAARRARDAEDEPGYARLHRMSVRLNMVILALLLLLGSAIAGRPG